MLGPRLRSRGSANDLSLFFRGSGCERKTDKHGAKWDSEMCIKCQGNVKLIKHGNSLSLGGKAKEGVKGSLRFLTRTEYVIKMSSKCVSNILLLLFLVIFMFFLSEHIPFNSYKNKGLLLL